MAEYVRYGAARYITHTTRDYDSFVDRRTGEKVAGGTKFTVWILRDDSGSAPVPANVPQDLRPHLEGLKLGDSLDLTLGVTAKAVPGTTEAHLSYFVSSLQPTFADVD